MQPHGARPAPSHGLSAPGKAGSGALGKFSGESELCSLTRVHLDKDLSESWPVAGSIVQILRVVGSLKTVSLVSLVSNQLSVVLAS